MIRNIYRANILLRRTKREVLKKYRFNQRTLQFEVKQPSLFARIKKIIARIRVSKK